MNWDVCVVGGGPAGAVCARRLAELGHRVVLVERRPFPRPHVGEALSPGVVPLLDVLGLAVEVMPSRGALVRWEDSDVRLVPPMGAVTVDRGRFDRALLAAARDAGVVVRQPVRAGRPRRVPAGWLIPLRGQADLRARFVVDASGRGRALGGAVTATGARTLALHALWRGEQLPRTQAGPDGMCRDEGLSRIETGPDGWCWRAPLPDGTVRVMAFVDPELVRAAGSHGVERLYRGLVGGLVDGDAGDVEVCDATGYTADSPVTGDSIRIGEAAFALDPLSSSGVDKALQSALAAAVTVHTLLADDGDHTAALAFYRDSHHRAVSRHAEWTADFYSRHRPHRDRPFWRRRSAPSPSVEPTAFAALTPDLLTRPVRLAAAASVVPTPCPVGDVVTMRRALVHPALSAPVAFLDGAELAPLLDCLGQCSSLADVLNAWSRRLSPDRALAVARWLYGRGLLS